jgi:hypothetical protein
MFQSSIRYDNGPDYIYYDMTCTNRNTNNDAGNTQLIFKDIRQNVIIDKPENYLLSVIRFQLDTTSVPIHRFEVQPNQGNPDLGIYSVTLEYDDGVNPVVVTQPEYLYWIPVDLDVSVPTAPSLNPNGLQSDTDYYYSYSYEHMMRLCNTALSEAMIKLKALTAPVLDTVDPPYMKWYVERGSASLFAFKDKFDQSVKPVINIYFNRPLHFLFSSMPFIQMQHNATKNRHYKIVSLPYFTESVGIDTYIRIDQEYNTTACWTPVSSIVFTTGSLPVVSNELSNPLVYENNRMVQLNRGNDQKQSIITDFITDENSYRSNLVYTANVYRYITLLQSQPIRQIDITVWWKNKFGELKPFFLDAGASCSLKIMLKRKINSITRDTR